MLGKSLCPFGALDELVLHSLDALQTVLSGSATADPKGVVTPRTTHGYPRGHPYQAQRLSDTWAHVLLREVRVFQAPRRWRLRKIAPSLHA